MNLYNTSLEYDPIGLSETALSRAHQKNKQEWGESHPSFELVQTYARNEGHPAFIASMLNHQLICPHPGCKSVFDLSTRLERARQMFEVSFSNEGSLDDQG